MTEPGCKIGEELDLIHKWVHKSLAALCGADVERANQLGTTILHLMNDGEGADLSNGIKLLALFDALACGAAHMEEFKPNDLDEDDATGTIQ